MTEPVSEPAIAPKPPRTIEWAVIAIAVQVVFAIINAAVTWGYTSQLSTLLVKANHDLKAGDKNKKDPYTAAQITHDLHSYRISVTTHAVIIAVLFGVAGYTIWRGRGMAKWLYIVASIVFSFGGIFALSASGPRLSNLTLFISALACVVAIILLILPESSRYFAAVKALRMPPVSARNTSGEAARPAGLRGLFAPPPPRAPRPAGSAGARPAGLRGLFAPPPPRAPRGGAPAEESISGESAAKRPATVRPAGKRNAARTAAAGVVDQPSTSPDGTGTESVGSAATVPADVTDAIRPDGSAARGKPKARGTDSLARGKSRRG